MPDEEELVQNVGHRVKRAKDEVDHEHQGAHDNDAQDHEDDELHQRDGVEAVAHVSKEQEGPELGCLVLRIG